MYSTRHTIHYNKIILFYLFFVCLCVSVCGLLWEGVYLPACPARSDLGNTFYTLCSDKTKYKILEGGVFREKNFFERLKRFALGTTLLKPFLDFG